MRHVVILPWQFTVVNCHFEASQFQSHIFVQRKEKKCKWNMFVNIINFSFSATAVIFSLRIIISWTCLGVKWPQNEVIHLSACEPVSLHKAFSNTYLNTVISYFPSLHQHYVYFLVLVFVWYISLIINVVFFYVNIQFCSQYICCIPTSLYILWRKLCNSEK